MLLQALKLPDLQWAARRAKTALSRGDRLRGADSFWRCWHWSDGHFSERRLLFGKHTAQARKAVSTGLTQDAAVMNAFTELDQLVKPNEAAKLLLLSRRSLRRYETAGRLTAIKFNSRVTRYRLAEVLRLMGKEVGR